MRYYQFLLASAYTTVSNAYVGSFLPPLLKLYKILLYIDVPYFKIGSSTVKTVPKFEFRGSNLGSTIIFATFAQRLGKVTHVPMQV